jgi:serine/threonine protein phosphatase PrpC
MVIQQKNEPSDSTHHTYSHTTTDAYTTEQAGQPNLALRVGSLLDPGIRRKHRPNEDTVLITQGVIPSLSASIPPEPFVLLMVADGMGGQGHGQEASRLAAQSLVEYISSSLSSQSKPSTDLLSLLSTGVQFANRAVYQRNQERQTVMGTTMTVALVSETTAYIAHVGDSRLYLYREPYGLTQLTRDHSIVASLVANGIIAPDDIYTHPQRNLVYRSLGAEASVEVEAFAEPLAAGDTLLLCSDGLWEMVRDQQIATILASSRFTPSDTANALIRAALAGGGEDNVSAIVAQVNKL